MQQITFTLFCLLVINLSVIFGQVSLTGTVLETDNTPVIGAVIRLEGSSGTKNTITDITGNFEFANLDGKYDKRYDELPEFSKGVGGIS